MLDRSRKPLRLALLTAVALSLGACSDDAGPGGMMFVNPSTIIVQNELEGPIIFFFARSCGTTDWGPDLLPADPATGTIQPGEDRSFTVEAGCYDLRAQHLETTDPGPLVEKIMENVVASPVTPFTWKLSAPPTGPA